MQDCNTKTTGGKSVFSTESWKYVADPTDIAMFWIQKKVIELHELLQKAERQGHIVLEELSVQYHYTDQIHVEQRGRAYDGVW